MTRDELAKRITDTALLRGEFTLRSGRKSNYYLDKYRFETQPDVLRALVGYEPGKTIELEVQRAGQLIRVPVRLSPRPFALEGGDPRQNSATFVVEREEAAQKYWDENFAKLLDQQPM